LAHNRTLKIFRYADEPVAMMRALRQRRGARPTVFAVARVEHDDVVDGFDKPMVAHNRDAIGAFVR
jgi:hypothetical protein